MWTDFILMQRYNSVNTVDRNECRLTPLPPFPIRVLKELFRSRLPQAPKLTQMVFGLTTREVRLVEVRGSKYLGTLHP